ncbi:MAG: P-loop NTPase fold protein [Planctomycetota bacterium]|nr:P-loop NTPase fold protein [Planctomycetota bacterium]
MHGDQKKLEELRPLFLLSDEPIGCHSDDFLSRDGEAKTIAGAVLGTTGPFSVGIYGEWGTGKTSLLNHVKSLLDETDPKTGLRRYPYLVTVMFNAWQHEKDAVPLAHLAEAVDAAVTQRLSETRGTLDEAGWKAVQWLRSVLLAARSLVYATSVESRFDPTDELPQARRWHFWKWIPFFKFSGKDAIDRYEKLQKEMGKPGSDVWKSHIKQSVTRAVLTSFRADTSLLEKVRPGAEKRIPRVVVFIDDMDRCMAEDAFSLLQSIKLALAQPGFIFVMTLDPTALQPYIDKKASEAGQNAGATSKAIYLDKLVQLAYPLRLHDEQFTVFVNKLVDGPLEQMLDPSQGQVFKQLTQALIYSSQKNPRTLVRRINGLLTDARSASPHIKSSLDGKPDVAEGVFLGLCLIRHTLRQFVGVAETMKLSNAEALCTLIRTRGLDECLARVSALSQPQGVEESPASLARRQKRGSEADGIDEAVEHGEMSESEQDELRRGQEVLRLLSAWPRLDALFKTEPGQRWLGSKQERELVETFYAKRPEETKPKASVNTRDEAVPTQAPVDTDKPDTRSLIPKGELEIIERRIRGELDLPADAPLGPAEMASVKTLGLSGNHITDIGAAWLAHPNTGLQALRALYLSATNVTDAGVKELARADTGLKVLTTMSLHATNVTDEGVKELARADTGLKTLQQLFLCGTNVTDAGVKELARADTGLKALTTLSLRAKKVTDAGVKELARADTGLKTLQQLFLSGTNVTDAGVKELARADTGLNGLQELNLAYTNVTDEGVEELARTDSGLKALTVLDLTGTNVTDAAVKALTRTDTGLKALERVSLINTKVTDVGVKEFTSAATRLKTLQVTYLTTTDTGLTVKGLNLKA